MTVTSNSVRRLAPLFAALALLGGAPALAQDDGGEVVKGVTRKEAEAATGPTVAGVTLENAPKFFKRFFDSKEPPKRDAFETDEEYAARARASVDPGKVYYVVVQRPKARVDDTPPFDYDLKTETLTIYAGISLLESVKNRATFKTVPLCVSSLSDVVGEYEATNGFGAKLNVKRVAEAQYILNVTNNKAFSPGVFDFRKNRLGMSVKLPREEARRLSEDAVIVIGFRIVSLKDSRSDVGRLTPTLRFPYDVKILTQYVDAELVEVRLVDGANGMTLATETAQSDPKKKK